MDWPFGKRRRPFGFGFGFDDIFADMEKEFEDMQRMMEDAQKSGKAQSFGPIVRGFSMRIGPDGKPVFQEFGNTKPPSKEEPTGEREPLVDVIEEKDAVTVIVELPGVEKSDIKLNATPKSLSINVDTAQRKYAKSIALPAEVKPASAKANYKNGVLEVKLERIVPKKPEGAEIKVE